MTVILERDPKKGDAVCVTDVDIPFSSMMTLVAKVLIAFVLVSIGISVIGGIIALIAIKSVGG